MSVSGHAGPTELAIYGAGGFAREVAWLADSCNEGGANRFRVVCFIDDAPDRPETLRGGIPVLDLHEARTRFPRAAVVRGIGNPKASEAALNAAESVGMRPATIVHPSVPRSAKVELEDGVVVCAGSILTTDIHVGRHVQINLGCTVGHDAILGAFTTLAPGVHISGCVELGSRVYVGTGAVILNGTADAPIRLGDDVVVGAGACVTRSVEAGVTVVGVPAKPIAR